MTDNLNHLPGTNGLPIVGDYLKISKKGRKFFEEQRDTYGDIYKFKLPTGMVVGFFGEKSTIDLLKNYGEKVNIRGPGIDFLGPIYPNSIMSMDGEKHKKHKSILMKAFQKPALIDYIKELPRIIALTMDTIHQKNVQEVYPLFKRLTIRITGELFFGLKDEGFMEKVNKAITPMGQAMVTIPLNIPGTVFNKGVKGRKYLSKEFLKLVPKKRSNPGPDFFSKLCLAANEDGDTFTDTEIVDHLLFLYQAAYDTTSWSLSYLVYCICKHPEWQEKMREEIKDVDIETITLTELLGLKISTMVFNESMRLAPSVPQTVRETNEDITLVDGVTIPKGIKIWVSLAMPMKDPKHWKNPELFDPSRFSEDRQEHKKCPHAFLPFGAGPHQCMGRVFAEIIIKMTMIALLKNFKLSVADDYFVKTTEFPIMRAKDGVPVSFEVL